MKDKNKKGFTLVELLAAVIVLIIIIFLAISKIRETQLKAQYKAMKANAISYINAVNDLASVDSLTSSRMHTGTFGKYLLKSYGIKLSGTEPDVATVTTKNFEVETACLSYGIYKVIYKNNDYEQPVEGKCTTGDAILFAYTGYEQEFVVPFDGVYQIEAWGASGGQATSYEGSEVLAGGLGGYAVGEMELRAGQVLYVNVGGKGIDDFYPNSGEGSTLGGYNGGGSAYGQYGSEPLYRVTSGGGGGASSVSLRPGLLKDLSNYTDNILIVAGGGGGATSHRYNNSSNYWRGTGGNAGGFTSVGGKEYGRSRVPTSATYTSGGCGYDNNGSRGCAGFGQGQNGSWSGGGGGGYYGGGASVHSATSGGSSYIGNFLLNNKVMYCKDCVISGDTNTKTETTLCSSSEPKTNCSKQGDGYVRISVVSNKNKNSGKYYFAYQNTEEEFVTPKTGKYKLEVWGAQGGSYSTTGGYGAYAVGYVNLQEKDKLYINVGGTSNSTAGGYNGGGVAGSYYNARGGGGATSITLSHGLLSTFSENQSQVVIVAGGGGGSDKYEGGSNGGSAGGISGMPGNYYRKEGEAEFTVATGGTQTEGGFGATGAGNGTDGTFGLGGSQYANHGGGGGGGYYGGGGGSYNSAVVGSGAGGSSYIGYSLLSNKSMYCYNCDESTDSSTKTISTECSNSVPTEKCSKLGNGFAIITLVE